MDQQPKLKFFQTKRIRNLAAIALAIILLANIVVENMPSLFATEGDPEPTQVVEMTPPAEEPDPTPAPTGNEQGGGTPGTGGSSDKQPPSGNAGEPTALPTDPGEPEAEPTPAPEGEAGTGDAELGEGEDDAGEDEADEADKSGEAGDAGDAGTEDETEDEPAAAASTNPARTRPSLHVPTPLSCSIRWSTTAPRASTPSSTSRGRPSRHCTTSPLMPRPPFSSSATGMSSSPCLAPAIGMGV